MLKNNLIKSIRNYLPVFLFILVTTYTIITRLLSGNNFTFEYQVHVVLLIFVGISFLFKNPATLFTTLVVLVIGLFFPSVFIVGSKIHYYSFSIGFLHFNGLYFILLILFIICNYKLIPGLIQWAFNNNSSANN
ncbi:MAG TPA: hypothetical protein PLJ00_06025 [Chitinophagales bacterium]|nr:hypothetical protein [Chitinophagales bacterium]